MKYLLVSLIGISSWISCEEVTSTPIQKEVDLPTTCSYKVQVSPKDGKIITEIVTTMGSSSVVALGFKRSHLKKLGAKLKGVGSLQFLGYIFTHENLVDNMKKIRQSKLKWDGFIDGLVDGLTKEADSGLLYKELPDFAKAVNCPLKALEQPAKEKNWNNFVDALVKG